MATAIIPGRDAFKLGESFSFDRFAGAGIINSDKKGFSVTMVVPKYIPENLSPAISDGTINLARNGSGQTVTPSGTITFTADRRGDYLIRIVATGTTAAGNAVAYAAIVAHLSGTITFEEAEE